MRISGGTEGRRVIINPESQFPGSGYSDRFKPSERASTGHSYDGWNTNPSDVPKYNSIKAAGASWQRKARSYNDRLDETDSDIGSSGRGESYEDTGNFLTMSQRRGTCSF